MKTHVVYASMEIAGCESMRLSRPHGDSMCIYLTVLIFLSIYIYIIHFNLLNPYLSAKTGIMCKLVTFCVGHTHYLNLMRSYERLSFSLFVQYVIQCFFQFLSRSAGLMDFNIDVSLRCMEPFLDLFMMKPLHQDVTTQ